MGSYAIDACRLWIVAVVAASTSAAPAAAEVYKCNEPSGGVLYSDVPCKGGAVVDVRAGDADPRAIARLQRDDAAFDRKMAARRAAEDMAAIRREELAARRAAAEQMADAGSPQYYYDPGYWWVPASGIKHHGHADKHVHEPSASRQKVPAPPSPLLTKRQRP